MNDELCCYTGGDHLALGGKGKMSGTGWHIEYIGKYSGKRSRKKKNGKSKQKCIYYENGDSNVCLKKMCDCLGVKGCKFYKD